MNRRFIIAAPSSNAGKTTVTLGLLRLLKRKGLDVRPFKSGPDYIDPKFHELAAGTSGINLDLFMMSEQEIVDSLKTFSEAYSVQCIEGAMGLFDGADKAKGSSAELAKKIEAPVVLVVNAKAVAYSVAPLIQGFMNFDANLTIAGVIFNRVGSARHYTILREACEDINVPVFGYLRQVEGAEIPSRYLGLNIDAIQSFDVAIDKIADEMEVNLNWEQILACSKVVERKTQSLQKDEPKSKLNFAVARDEAFTFIYPQLIRAMSEIAEVVYFSPLRDKELPIADFVYLPGGYPEMYLDTLVENQSMLKSIKEYAVKGGRIFAECGGMMYLGNEMVDKTGLKYKLVGYFNFSTSMQTPKLHLGYRTITINENVFKGHEFHYSVLLNDEKECTIGDVKNARDVEVNTPLFQKQNVLASYLHFFIGNAQQLKTLISLISNNLKIETDENLYTKRR